MGLFSMFTSRGKADAAYKRGMKKANARDHEGAIAEYNTVIDMSNCPGDIRAMAMYNRALAYSGLRQYDKAQKDLDIVLQLPEAPSEVLAAARDKIKRMKKLLEQLLAQQAEEEAKKDTA